MTPAVQLKPGVPVPFGMIVHVGGPMAPREPWPGELTILNVRLGPSMSIPLNLIKTAVSSAVATDWLTAIGASFTGVTVMETVAGLLSRLPSLALKVKLSEPL